MNASWLVTRGVSGTARTLVYSASATAWAIMIATPIPRLTIPAIKSMR